MQLVPCGDHDSSLASLETARSPRERARRDRQMEAWRRATPAFEGGYRDLAPGAHRVEVEGVEVDIADLADVIRSKEAAGRPKDLQVLPLLYRHLESRRQGGE